jgi:hypothetical protein
LTVFAKIDDEFAKVFTNLWGETYKIIVLFLRQSQITRLTPLLSGRNPSKTNLSLGNPLLTKAGTNAVAPGKHSTSTRFQHKHESIKPDLISLVFPHPKSKLFSSFNLEMRFYSFVSVVHVMAVHVCHSEML